MWRKALPSLPLCGFFCAALWLSCSTVLSQSTVVQDPSFAQSTSSAPWAAGGNAYVAAVLQDSSTGTDITVAYRGGGVAYTGQSGGTSNNDQWLANDYMGASWTYLGPAGWSARAYGSTIYVPLAAGLVNGILLIAGGVPSGSTIATNDVWSSVDMFSGSARTLGTNWVLNGGQSCKVNCVAIAFSPRALSGLIVATAFNNQSTVYAYLMGGVGQIAGFGSGTQPFNDVYYTVGKGITPWKRLSGSAPWIQRFGFGIQNYTFSSGVTGVIIVGGYSSFSSSLNDVWTWDPTLSGSTASKGWMLLVANSGSLPTAGYINLLRNTTNVFLIGGQQATGFGTGVQLNQPYTTQPGNGVANWIGTSPGLPNPQRANQSVVAVRNLPAGVITGFVYMGGIGFDGSNFTPLNDVWYAQAE